MTQYVDADMLLAIYTFDDEITNEYAQVPDKSGKRGCSWSRSFKPVKGWDADETRLYSDKPTQSYHVRQCPEFVRG